MPEIEEYRLQVNKLVLNSKNKLVNLNSIKNIKNDTSKKIIVESKETLNEIEKINPFNNLNTKVDLINPNSTKNYTSEFNFYSNIDNVSQNYGILNYNFTNIREYLHSLSIVKPESELMVKRYKMFNFTQRNSYNYPSIKDIYTILSAFFNRMRCFISMPYVNVYNDKVEINLAYFKWLKKQIKRLKTRRKKTYLKIIELKYKTTKSLYLKRIASKKYENRFRKIIIIIKNLFNKKVNIKLIKIYRPSFDSNILANAIGYLSDKVKPWQINKSIINLKHMPICNTLNMKKNKVEKDKLLYLNDLFNGRIDNPITNLAAFMCGYQYKLAGRLLKQRIIPKKTKKCVIVNRIARGKTDFVNKARFTNKNKIGAYSISIKIAYVLNDKTF